MRRSLNSASVRPKLAKGFARVTSAMRESMTLYAEALGSRRTRAGWVSCALQAGSVGAWASAAVENWLNYFP
ncbi:ORF218 [Saltwater crocodilepox virus]|nr:ORF001 [Saltwater crocodilepox virus]QGT48369.1 ORF218 [Saltwater crocodilepox virus]QGT48370.1 ORF001 [Saltwater crocodilepox virus]QGT48583.1 ORF218 [Saltwater crocodilepox virus]